MTGNYNSWLVLLSIVVATVASYVALDLASRVAATQGTRSSRYWLFGGALSMGTGIWSMHFIGMLAFQLPIQMSYNIPITLASLLIAAIASGFALYSISHGSLSWRRLLLAGLLMGIGIAAMHYTGMAAMELNPPVRYSPSIFTASVVIAIVASMVALWIAFQLRTETILSAFWKKAGSAVVMGVAITGMHYTGMAAAVFAPDTVCSVSPQDINNVWLAGAIGGFTFMLLATTLLVSVFDAHLANRAAKHAENLRLVNVDLEKQAAELSQTNVQLQEEVKERARSEEKIQYLAYHDGLTTLPNRALFSKILNHGISQAHRRKKELAVLFIDLDRFKNINDTLGHEAGDSLLQEVGKRLKQCLRESDTVARLGGDEFVVLLEDLEDQTRVSVVAHKILVTLVKPFTTLGQEFRVTASIGISTYPTDGEDEKSLMKNADIAMYRAKEEGKNNFQFYSKELNEHSFERLTMESNLRRALERNEFELHYQPKVDLRTSRITGVEALLRWRHPELGMVGPLQFIPMAEETGLIVPIGKWVLRTACRQQKAWQDQGLPQMSVAVNLSARADERGRQPVGPTVFGREPPAGHHRHSQGKRNGSDSPGAGNHREHAHAQRREGDTDPGRAQRHGHPARHRRFWNGLFLALDAQAVSDQHDQGRPFVYPRPSRRGRRPCHHRRHHCHGSDPGHDRDCRGCRNQGAGGLPARAVLRRVSGFLFQETHAGERARKTPAGTGVWRNCLISDGAGRSRATRPTNDAGVRLVSTGG